MSAEEIRQQQLIQLKEILINWFSQDELEDLSFDLGVDYRALGGQSKESNVRILIMELSRRGRLPRLLALCDQKRPEIEWGIFSYLLRGSHTEVVAPESTVPASPPLNRSGNSRLLVTLIAVLAAVILTGAGASTYFLTRTTDPAPTKPPPVVQVPVFPTPVGQPISVLPTATNVVITAIPKATAEPTEPPTNTPTPTLIIVETATLPVEVANLEPPFTVKITDTYQGDRLQEANIRSGPGIEYEILEKRGPNSEIVVWAWAYNSTGLPWYLMELGDGQLGWISSVLVDLEQTPFERVPPAATVPPTYTPIPSSTPTETAIPTESADPSA